jgi:hypothetical protein
MGTEEFTDRQAEAIAVIREVTLERIDIEWPPDYYLEDSSSPLRISVEIATPTGAELVRLTRAIETLLSWKTAVDAGKAIKYSGPGTEE